MSYVGNVVVKWRRNRFTAGQSMSSVFGTASTIATPRWRYSRMTSFHVFSKISTKSLSRLSPRRRVFFSDKIANKNEGIVEKTRKIQEGFVQVLKRDDAMSKNIMLIDKKQVHNNRLQVINQYTIGQDQVAKHRSWLRCSSGWDSCCAIAESLCTGSYTDLP